MLEVNRQPTSVFVTYIVGTPGQVWAALTDGAVTPDYFFGRRIAADWNVGSTWQLFMQDGTLDCRGEVLECEAQRRLALSWHVEWIEEMRKLPPGKVTYQIDPLGDMVRLTVSEFHHPSLGPEYHEGGRRGWPLILSGLKTLIETGKPLPKLDPRKLME